MRLRAGNGTHARRPGCARKKRARCSTVALSAHATQRHGFVRIWPGVGRRSAAPATRSTGCRSALGAAARPRRLSPSRVSLSRGAQRSRLRRRAHASARRRATAPPGAACAGSPHGDSAVPILPDSQENPASRAGWLDDVNAWALLGDSALNRDQSLSEGNPANPIVGSGRSVSTRRR